MPWQALPWQALPCVALPWHAVALALPHSRHSEKVRLLEAWHVGSVRASCTKPARSMSAACAQCSICRQNFWKPWLVVPWQALPFLGMSCLGLCTPCVALPCLALPCLALACRGLGIAPFKAFRESEAIGSLACLGMSAACAHHARSLCAACRQRARSAQSVGRIFRNLVMPWHVGRLRAACAQAARSMLKMSTEVFKPCQTPFLFKFPRTISSL